ncbi:beta strand repeat-containing protein, partial [Jejudonia soesokkakensis]
MGNITISSVLKKIYTSVNLKKRLIITFLMGFISFLSLGQSIPASNTRVAGSPCFGCVPDGWTLNIGTPDMSNDSQAAASGALGGGDAWTSAPLPLPPNGHTDWITLRDLGSSGTEEAMGTTITGLTPGAEYEIYVYSLTALTTTYSPAYIDFYQFQVGTLPEVNVNSVPQEVSGVWGTNSLRFTANANNMSFEFTPGNNGPSGFSSVECVNLSVSLNAINPVPIANNDSDTVVIGNNPSVNVALNDSDNTNIVLSTIDLDPSTSGIQNSFASPNGNWSVDGSGNVTFIPTNSNFTGTESITYTIDDDYTLDGNALGATSSPATISATITPIPDTDGDGFTDDIDICPGNDDNLDADSDGVPDGCDSDDDNDGIPDYADNPCDSSFTFNQTAEEWFTLNNNTLPAISDPAAHANDATTGTPFCDIDIYGPANLNIAGTSPTGTNYIVDADDTGGNMWLRSPNFGGLNASGAAGGQFQYDAYNYRVGYTGDPNWGGGDVEVILYDTSGGFIRATRPLTGTPGGNTGGVNGNPSTPGSEYANWENGIWNTFTFNLDTTDFTLNNGAVSVAAVLADLDQIAIRMEFVNGGNSGSCSDVEYYALDNIIFVSPGVCNTDTDNDGINDDLDLDADNDGIYDVIEAGLGAFDTNNDGVINSTDSGFIDANNDGTDDRIGVVTLPDSDGDGIPDYRDSDSDNDGCSDADEAYATVGTDADGNGYFGTGNPPPTNSSNGTVSAAPYNPTNVNDTTNAGSDSDSDGIADFCDPDSDNDGNPDVTDPNPATPTAINDSGNATAGLPSTIQILSNDDFTDNTDDNGDPNNNSATSVTNITTVVGVNTTAMGTIAYDPATGELTYTPTFAEGGTTVTIEYRVCNDVNGDSPGTTTDDVCDTAVATIMVAFGDEDGDGVPDNLDECPGFDDNTNNDGDALADGCDDDDDNDGIIDTAESGGNDPNGDEDGDGIPNFMDDTDDDPGNTLGDGSTTVYGGADANGDGIQDVYDFDNDGIPNFLDLDSDNDGLYDVLEAGFPDGDNNGIADGPINATTGIPATGGGTPTDSGPTAGTTDFLDLDSDEDGCSDANEFFNDSNADGGDGGSFGTGEPQVGVNSDGTVIGATYGTAVDAADTDTNATADYTEEGPEFDTDGIANACDLDDDGDGNPDAQDPNPNVATVAPDTGMTDFMTPVTVNVLDNDDYLPNNDTNNVGTTSITLAAFVAAPGLTEAMGTVVFDPATGTATYTPDAAEDGEVTFYYEVCSDDGVTTAPNNVVCMTTTVTITVDGSDNDNDGVPDGLDLDDDNDGILDTAENDLGLDPSDDNDSDGIPNWQDADDRGDGTPAACVDTTPNDGVCDMLDPAYDFDGDGVPNHFDLDSDNDGLYDVTETGGTDANNDGLADDTDGDTTNNNGVPNSSNGGAGIVTPTDSGPTPGTPDFLDVDSDEDGCSDANEAYNDSNADGGDGGQYGTGDPLTLSGGGVDANGAVTASGAYPALSSTFPADTDTNATADYTEEGPEFDTDGIANACDLDDDGDGNPDAQDPNPNV